MYTFLYEQFHCKQINMLVFVYIERILILIQFVHEYYMYVITTELSELTSEFFFLSEANLIASSHLPRNTHC